MADNRCVALLYGDTTCVVESATYWLLSVGPRPFDVRLRQSLLAAISIEDLRELCTSPAAQDNALLVIDKNASSLHVITGPLNITKIFCGELEGRLIVSSSIRLFPRKCLTMNSGAVASYVLNGCCLNGHTVFQEIAVLDRASRHEFVAGKHKAAAYWDFVPGRAAADSRSSAGTTGALWDLLVQSVSRLTAGKRVLLALSGGYDSGVLLGILGGYLKHPEVQCFSYVHGKARSGSDAEVAALRAAHYGYEHMAVNSYSGDLIQMLDSNAHLCQALRCPSYEIEAFPALVKHYGTADSIMLFGDECFGWGSYRLNRPDDILGAINLKSPALLDNYSSMVELQQSSHLRDSLEAEYSQLRKRTRDFANPDDAKDFLYLDQRLQYFLLPLRTLIAGYWFPVAMPLISTDVIDFMATIPTTDRVDKRLFKQMARQFLPDLFRIRQATRNQIYPDFDSEIVAARETLLSVVANRHWNIEGCFSSQTLVDLVSELRSKRAREGLDNGTANGFKRALKKRAKRLLASSRILEERQRWIRRLSFNEFTKSSGPEFELLNILCLADFLADSEFDAAHDAKSHDNNSVGC